MFEIKGLDKLQRDLAEAQQAIASMEGEIGTVSFDPSEPASIENAVQEIHRLIDERLGGYASNPIVGPLIEEMKDKYRSELLDQAAQARLQGE